MCVYTECGCLCRGAVGVQSNRRGHIFLPRVKGDAYLGLKWAGCYTSSGCACVPLNIPCSFLLRISTIAPWLLMHFRVTLVGRHGPFFQHSWAPAKIRTIGRKWRDYHPTPAPWIHSVTHFLLNKWHGQLECATAMWVVSESFKLKNHLPRVCQLKRNRDQTIHIIWLFVLTAVV